ncbi:hypothetical protein OHB41_16350 [Streptomyces sp. NBC_01571]|uniref:hypothetical protein n=1 Tax=Streptomyces sp. NBC_01571 TaxID=2975883 RepID=UPI002251C49E|nr:hypothetical protein [Streptomyces sp. NBC_01571]MCX4574733.1 hypothetical protein [Streptomyces sp. NBC_01571]
MRVSRFAAALGVAAAILVGGATGASAAAAPSVVSHATHDRGHDHRGGDRDGRWGHDHDGRWGHHRGDRDGRWGHDHDGRWGHDRDDHR